MLNTDIHQHKFISASVPDFIEQTLKQSQILKQVQDDVVQGDEVQSHGAISVLKKSKALSLN